MLILSIISLIISILLVIYSVYALHHTHMLNIDIDNKNKENEKIYQYLLNEIDNKKDYLNDISKTLDNQKELSKQAYILAKNQNGCRYLQNYIASNPELFRNVFFNLHVFVFLTGFFL